MRTITLEKRIGALGTDMNVKILVNGQIVDELFEGEMKKIVKLYEGSQVVVAKVFDEDNKEYASNAFFVTGSKDANAFIDLNGMRVTIKER